MQCPLCDETLMKSNLKAVNVLANTADIKMALFGQAPDAIMEVALQAIKFFNLQQQVVSEARETRLADKAIQIRDQCNTKLAEFQNAYNNVKRKYQAVTQENTNMKVETRELHDKYAAKSKQNLNLQRMLSEVNINSARGRGGGSGGGGGVMANNMGPRSSSLSNLSNGSGGSGGHMVTTVHRQQMFSLGGTTPPRDPTMGGYGTDRLPAMMRGSTGPAHASGSAAQASQRREILQLLPDELSDDDEQDLEEQAEVDDGDEMLDDIEALNYDDLTAVAKLSGSQRYKEIMESVRVALETETTMEEDTTKVGINDPVYHLLVQCNKLAVDMDNEMSVVHNFVRDKYRLKFPELESLVHHPVDYARVVKRIGNEMDLTLVDLDDMLPAATVMVVTVTGTTTSGKALSAENLQKVEDGCEMALKLDEDKRLVLKFVESKMSNIAPNLSIVCGSEVAAKLMGVAGGLVSLSKMPACNVQVLGARKKNLAGMSSATTGNHQGFVVQCPLVMNTPPALKLKAMRLVASKCTLLARVDAYGQDPAGAIGIKMRDEIAGKIEKWQEPAPAKIIRPLPAPDAEGKKRRGGKRLRKMKERYGMTDMRKAANRVNFNQAEEEYLDGDEIIGLGTLGSKEGSGRLRVVAKEQKMKLSAKTAKKVARQNASRGGAVSGFQSSLAFTPVQGFELADPTKFGAAPDSERSGTESYFSSLGGFRSVKKLG
ncbi:hypothetical protein FOA52_014611 [Chlamydomonas sp. UWO 241]|nr:hypothetical protein FOA52_014611 [Chlamydomonas sp. UWO 241]